MLNILKNIVLFLLWPLIVVGKAWWTFLGYLEKLGQEWDAKQELYFKQYPYAPKTFLFSKFLPRPLDKLWDTLSKYTIYFIWFIAYRRTDSGSNGEYCSPRKNFKDYYINKRNYVGFTLFEMAMVLVVIGLLVGGALTGRDLIKAAQLRTIISDNEKFITALNTFKIKYDCVAGDCDKATNFFSGTVNGNGNGVIQWGNGGMPNAEGANVWNHLANAGLIAGTYPAISNLSGLTPSNFYPGPFNGTGYIFKQCFAHWSGTCVTGWDGAPMSLVSRPEGTQIIVLGELWTSDFRGFNPSLSSLDTQFIDTKVDDGMPNTGRIGAMGGTGTCMVDNTSPTSSYTNLNSSTRTCLLVNVLN